MNGGWEKRKLTTASGRRDQEKKKWQGRCPVHLCLCLHPSQKSTQKTPKTSVLWNSRDTHIRSTATHSTSQSPLPYPHSTRDFIGPPLPILLQVHKPIQILLFLLLCILYPKFFFLSFFFSNFLVLIKERRILLSCFWKEGRIQMWTTVLFYFIFFGLLENFTVMIDPLFYWWLGHLSTPIVEYWI